MRITQFLSSAGDACDKKAVAPLVWQESLSFRADASEDGDGTVVSDLLPAIAAGSPAAYGGTISNEGCCILQLVITYLDGQGCDPCVIDTLTTVDRTITVRPNVVMELPAGFISQITVQTVDSAGAAKAVTANQEIEYQACTVPCCSGTVNVP